MSQFEIAESKLDSRVQTEMTSHKIENRDVSAEDTVTLSNTKQSSLLYAEIQREVSKLLPTKLQFAKRGLYRDYYEFIDEFCRVGGIIEACPSSISKNVSSIGVLFLLEPDGEVEIQTTYEKLNIAPFCTSGFKFPQSSLPNLNVHSVDIRFEQLLNHWLSNFIKKDCLDFSPLISSLSLIRLIIEIRSRRLFRKKPKTHCFGQIH